jgi:hypothetical protein
MRDWRRTWFAAFFLVENSIFFRTDLRILQWLFLRRLFNFVTGQFVDLLLHAMIGVQTDHFESAALAALFFIPYRWWGLVFIRVA